MDESAVGVVLVEDQESDSLLIEAALRSNCPDAEVVVVHDGLTALESLLGDGDGDGASVSSPRLVILDLGLPGLGGMEVLRCLKADRRYRRIPVVVLSGECTPSDVGAARHYGAAACLRKPDRYDDMRSLIASIAQQWLAPARAAAAPI